MNVAAPLCKSPLSLDIGIEAAADVVQTRESETNGSCKCYGVANYSVRISHYH